MTNSPAMTLNKIGPSREHTLSLWTLDTPIWHAWCTAMLPKGVAQPFVCDSTTWSRFYKSFHIPSVLVPVDDDDDGKHIDTPRHDLLLEETLLLQLLTVVAPSTSMTHGGAADAVRKLPTSNEHVLQCMVLYAMRNALLQVVNLVNSAALATPTTTTETSIHACDLHVFALFTVQDAIRECARCCVGVLHPLFRDIDLIYTMLNGPPSDSERKRIQNLQDTFSKARRREQFYLPTTSMAAAATKATGVDGTLEWSVYLDHLYDRFYSSTRSLSVYVSEYHDTDLTASLHRQTRETDLDAGSEVGDGNTAGISIVNVACRRFMRECYWPMRYYNFSHHFYRGSVAIPFYEYNCKRFASKRILAWANPDEFILHDILADSSSSSIDVAVDDRNTLAHSVLSLEHGMCCSVFLDAALPIYGKHVTNVSDGMIFVLLGDTFVNSPSPSSSSFSERLHSAMSRTSPFHSQLDGSLLDTSQWCDVYYQMTEWWACRMVWLVLHKRIQASEYGMCIQGWDHVIESITSWCHRVPHNAKLDTLRQYIHEWMVYFMDSMVLLSRTTPSSRTSGQSTGAICADVLPRWKCVDTRAEETRHSHSPLSSPRVHHPMHHEESRAVHMPMYTSSTHLYYQFSATWLFQREISLMDASSVPSIDVIDIPSTIVSKWKRFILDALPEHLSSCTHMCPFNPEHELLNLLYWKQLVKESSPTTYLALPLRSDSDRYHSGANIEEAVQTSPELQVEASISTEKAAPVPLPSNVELESLDVYTGSSADERGTYFPSHSVLDDGARCRIDVTNKQTATLDTVYRLPEELTEAGKSEAISSLADPECPAANTGAIPEKYDNQHVSKTQEEAIATVLGKNHHHHHHYSHHQSTCRIVPGDEYDEEENDHEVDDTIDASAGKPLLTVEDMSDDTKVPIFHKQDDVKAFLSRQTIPLHQLFRRGPKHARFVVPKTQRAKWMALGTEAVITSLSSLSAGSASLIHRFKTLTHPYISAVSSSSTGTGITSSHRPPPQHRMSSTSFPSTSMTTNWTQFLDSWVQSDPVWHQGITLCILPKSTETSARDYSPITNLLLTTYWREHELAHRIVSLDTVVKVATCTHWILLREQSHTGLWELCILNGGGGDKFESVLIPFDYIQYDT